MSEQTSKNTKSELITELEGIVVKLNELPSMAKNFGGGVLGTIVKFIGKIVRKTDDLEERLRKLENRAQ